MILPDFSPGPGSEHKARPSGNAGSRAPVSLPEMTVMPTTRAVAGWPGEAIAQRIYWSLGRLLYEAERGDGFQRG